MTVHEKKDKYICNDSFNNRETNVWEQHLLCNDNYGEDLFHFKFYYFIDCDFQNYIYIRCDYII